MNRHAFYKITYGLYVAGARLGDKRGGFVANTVFQVTSEPPQLALACSNDNFTAGLIRGSRRFSVSALMRDANPELIKVFGYQSGKNLDKFASWKMREHPGGSPVLLEDSLAWFACEVVSVVELGSHALFIGQMVDGDLLDEGGEPLTYAYYRDVKKGRAPKNAPTYSDAAHEPAVAAGRFTCSLCGYSYDPSAGDPDHGVPAGTPFEKIPPDWVCPICQAGKTEFEKS